MPRALPVLLILLVAAPAAAAPPTAPPTGRRASRPRATHVVLVETKLRVGGAEVTLEPGAAVAGPRGPAPRRKLKVTAVGPVEVTGQVDGTALGMRLARDVELRTPDGKSVIGTAREGAFVRQVPGKAPAGSVLVEAVGPITVRGAVPADALTAEPRELVESDNWNVRTKVATELFPARDVKGPALARLAAGTELAGIEKDDKVVHVRTRGGLRIEGWLPVDRLAERDPNEAGPAPAPQLIKPTHEAFIDTPLYASAGAAKPIGLVRGGTLVQATPGAQGDFTKVLTRGDVIASGWVRTTDLRKLEDAVWTEPPLAR